jgi:hypothetical protein
MLVAILWVLFVQGGLWRYTIRLQLCGEAERVAGTYGGTVVSTWFGISVRTEKFSVRWVGSLRGVQTIVQGSRSKREIGLLTGQILESAIANVTAS